MSLIHPDKIDGVLQQYTMHDAAGRTRMLIRLREANNLGWNLNEDNKALRGQLDEAVERSNKYWAQRYQMSRFDKIMFTLLGMAVGCGTTLFVFYVATKW